MRIYRRAYRGPKLPLEPNLVNSASSQSVSLEKQELGNEADDELRSIHLRVSAQPIRRKKREPRQTVMRESWSLSDSELNDRRKRMARQHLTIQRSISHENESQELGDSDANRPAMENSESGIAAVSEHPLEVLKPIGDRNNQSFQPQLGTPEISVSSMCAPTQTYKSSLINKSTTDSVDSNYTGFGVSRLLRRDLLSNISDFQKLSPKNEETVDSFVFTNKTEPTSNDNQNHEIRDCTPTDTETNHSNTEQVLVIENPWTHNSYNYADITAECVINPNNDESGPNISFHDNAELFDDGSPLYGMFASIRIPDVPANTRVARYGDVISVISPNGRPMVFRIAGAGLQCGTVGENISFQVIKT